MTLRGTGSAGLPNTALRVLHDIQLTLGVDFRVWSREGPEARTLLHPASPLEGPSGPTATLKVGGRWDLDVELVPPAGDPDPPTGPLDLAVRLLTRTLESEDEIRFFTLELSERYEEINLLYSISETLGSVLSLEEAARAILEEVCDVLGAGRGSLWVHDAQRNNLELVASVGKPGREGPLSLDDPLAVTSQVFREGRPMILSRTDADLRAEEVPPGIQLQGETVLSVPIRYTPPSKSPKTVGVINLFGRRRGGKFTASDQKLLAAIASQVGAALENNRLIRESLARERMAREMELAHNLQMKLLPPVESHGDLEMAARVQPAEQVGGDFYHILRLPDGKVAFMIGDVSSHGFPAALIMTLSMTAATIYAAEVEAPARVLRHVDDAIHQELETTEMYLTLFYGVLDPRRGELTYANAGHPHAFLIRGRRPGQEGEGVPEPRRLRATAPPVGFAGPGEYGETTVEVDPEDLLFLFTDGLSDLLSSGRWTDGEARLLAEVQARSAEPPGAVVDALFEMALNARPEVPADDRTAVLVRVAPRAARGG